MLKNILEAPDKAPLHNFPYILYLPDGYDEDEREWPLVVYLHGAGERGRDLKTPYAYGIPQRIKDGDSFPFIFVAPQCDDPLYWAGCMNRWTLFWTTGYGSCGWTATGSISPAPAWAVWEPGCGASPLPNGSPPWRRCAGSVCPGTLSGSRIRRYGPFTVIRTALSGWRKAYG